MSDPESSSYRSLMVAAAIMAVVGWLGLILLLNTTLPTVGPRWLFFFLWTLAVTGTALPFVWVLHRRFDPARVSGGVLLRQSLLVGLLAGICMWLQINRTLTLPLALLLAVGLAGVEWLVRSVERSTWRADR
ncbi:MAG: hypothetical protein NTU91_02090 [Chloroflexi bacterium]|nr:hypothetical protein [Chloroflexota bacterium]